MKFLLAFRLIGILAAQITLTNYTLGNNLVANHDFSKQLVHPGVNHNYFKGSMVGWNCSNQCDIQNISLTSKTTVCKSIQLVANLDSNEAFDNMSQIISIPSPA
jgi:hypothetical protein